MWVNFPIPAAMDFVSLVYAERHTRFNFIPGDGNGVDGDLRRLSVAQKLWLRRVGGITTVPAFVFSYPTPESPSIIRSLKCFTDVQWRSDSELGT